MRSVAIALPEPLAAHVVGQFQRNGYQVTAVCSGAAELMVAVAEGATEFAVTSAAPAFLQPWLIDACDRAGVRMLALAGDDAERRHAAGLGLREVISATAPWEDIENALMGNETADPATMARHIRPPATEQAGPAKAQDVDLRPPGQVVAVWGPAGAPGRTTLSIAIAAELASHGFSVALADADTHGGSIAPSLGLLDEAPGFAAACRLAGSDSLNQSELERIGQRCVAGSSGFWVLTGIGSPSRWPELSSDRVTRTVRECRRWVDYTVIDTGFSLENDEEISSDLFAPRRNAATIAALREADRVIAVGSADPVGLSRFLRAHADLLEIVDAERVSVLMNKVRASAIGLDPSGQVEQTLHRFGGIVGATLVPYDRSAFDTAVLKGTTVQEAGTRSPARVAIGRFVVSHLVPPDTGESTSRMPWWRPRAPRRLTPRAE